MIKLAPPASLFFAISLPFRCFSMIVLAILCLGLSLLIFPGVRETVLTPVVDILMNTTDYSSTIKDI